VMSRCLDLVGALVAALLVWPLAVLAALAIAVDTRGGVLFRARRVGRGGRTFTMLKFRTMQTMQQTSGPRITAGDDDRITRVGRVLRRAHLDEIPQLWNVLRGEMSLVGPRPEDPALVDLSDERWQRVLSVRPGITGPTQLSFARRESCELRRADAEDVYVREFLPAKLASDIGYVESRSLAIDLGILIRTLLVPFRSAA
jgi:lipopolysaccharide/colanic/teichoic acid biosynthesis glycosyltransferase